MGVQVLQGYFMNDKFYQHGKNVKLPEKQMVIINVLDMPIESDAVKDRDMLFWEEFDRLAVDSDDEVLLPEDFPRTNFLREIVAFDEEGLI